MGVVIAIDGPAAAGKGTISKKIAAHFGILHLDTGLLYRAVAAKVMQGAEAVQAAQSLCINDLNAKGLRDSSISNAASKISKIAEVRAALVKFQRDFAAEKSGAVLDGRDIGTVICPNADVKLFITASEAVRARRRFLELSKKGAQTTFEQVLEDVKKRDARDQNRDIAPLIAAEDAITIDTSDMTIEQAAKVAISLVEKCLKQKS